MSENTGYADENMAGDYEENINWDTVGVPPAKGNYNFIVEKADYKPTAKGQHMVKVQFKIEAAVDMNNETYIGRTVFSNFVFTQQAAFTVKAFCKALEIPLPNQINKAILEDFAATLVGQQFGGTITHRPFRDQMQADVSNFCPIFDVSGTSVNDTSGAEAAGEVEQEEEVQEEESESEDVEQEEVAEEAVAPTRSIRAATATAPKANGHANGTNGKAIAKPATTKAPAKKTATSARR